MNARVFEFTLRRRLRATALASVSLVAVIVLEGALYPSLGESLGKVDLGSGVSGLIGGGDFSTLTGWFSTEVFSIYGPAFLIGLAITGIVGASASEEEDGILGLVLSLPLRRDSVLLSKWAAVAVTVVLLGIATWAGLIVGVAVAGGGIGAGLLAAQMLHMVMLGLVFGGLAFAVGCATGKRSLSFAVSVGLAVTSYLLDGLAPVSSATDWAQKLSPFYYYDGSDPVTGGVDIAHLAVLLGLAIVLTVVGVIGIRDRDLRG